MNSFSTDPYLVPNSEIIQNSDIPENKRVRILQDIYIPNLLNDDNQELSQRSSNFQNMVRDMVINNTLKKELRHQNVVSEVSEFLNFSDKNSENNSVANGDEHDVTLENTNLTDLSNTNTEHIFDNINIEDFLEINSQEIFNMTENEADYLCVFNTNFNSHYISPTSEHMSNSF